MDGKQGTRHVLCHVCLMPRAPIRSRTLCLMGRLGPDTGTAAGTLGGPVEGPWAQEGPSLAHSAGHHPSFSEQHTPASEQNK